MTTAEFAAWMHTNGLTDITAAPLLGAKQRKEVWRWRTGDRPVPPRVALIIELRASCPQGYESLP